VLGFLVLPVLVRQVVESNLSAALDRKVTIARLQINPFALSATLHDVSVAERGDGRPVLSLPEVDINGEIASHFRWAWGDAAVQGHARDGCIGISGRNSWVHGFGANLPPGCSSGGVA